MMMSPISDLLLHHWHIGTEAFRRARRRARIPKCHPPSPSEVGPLLTGASWLARVLRPPPTHLHDTQGLKGVIGGGLRVREALCVEPAHTRRRATAGTYLDSVWVSEHTHKWTGQAHCAASFFLLPAVVSPTRSTPTLAPQRPVPAETAPARTTAASERARGLIQVRFIVAWSRGARISALNSRA